MKLSLPASTTTAVELAYVSGSFAKENPRDECDIDIAIATGPGVRTVPPPLHGG